MSSETSSNQCSTTAESYLGLRTNSRFLKLKPNNEACQSLKSFHLKRRSWVRRPKKWLTNMRGSFSITVQSQMIKLSSAILSCSSSLKFCQTRSRTSTFMRPWWSFQAKCFKMPLKRLIFQNWRKKLADYLGLMHLTLPKGTSLTSRERRSTLSWRTPLQKKTQRTCSKD